MKYIIRDYKVTSLPIKGEPNARYYLSTDNGVEEYVTDIDGNFKKVQSPINVSAGTTSSNVTELIFSNGNNVTFGLSNNVITASAAGGGGAAGTISAGTSSIALGQVILSNSNNISFGLSGSTVTASVSVPTDYISTAQSSLFEQTSHTTIFLTNQSTQPVAASGSNGSFLFSTLSFGNSNGFSFYTTNGSIVGSYTDNGGGGGDGFNRISAGTQIANASTTVVFSNANNVSFGMNGSSVVTASASYTNPTDYISTNQSSLFQLTANMTDYLDTSYTSHTHDYVENSNSSLFQLTANMSDYLDTSYTSHTHDYVENANSSLFQLTSDNSLSLGTGYTTHTHSQYLNTSQSSLFEHTSHTTIFLTNQSTQPVAASASNGSFNFSTLKFVESNGVTWATSTDGIRASVETNYQSPGAYLTTAMLSNAGSNFVNTSAGLNLTNISATLASNSISLSVGNYLTTAMASNRGSDFVQANAVFNGTNASGTIASNAISVSVAAQSAQTGISSMALSNTTYTSGQVSFRDGNGISWASTTGQGISITHELQHTSATSAITSNAVHTSAARIQAIAASDTTYISGSVTFRDLNGITWQSTTGQQIQITHGLQYTSATSAITSAAVHTSSPRIQGIIGSNTTYTSGSVGLRDLNGITWQSTTGQSFQITHDLQYTSNTSAITSNALNTSQSSLFRHTSQNSQLQFTSQMSDYLGTAQSSKYVQNWKLTGNTAGTTSSAQGTDLWLAGGNNITISGSSNTISFSVGNYLTTARASTDAIGLNTAQSNVTWTVNSSGLSLDGRGYAGTGTSATNASVTLNSNGLQISVAPGGGVNPVASASNGSFSFTTLAFSNANNVTFGTSAGSIITASVSAQSNVAFSAANASSTFQTLSLQDSNGISFSNNAGAIRLTHDLQYTSNTSAITSNALNTSASSRFIQNWKLTGNTAGTSSSAQGSDLWLSGGNNITVSGNNNSIVFSVGNYITTARASTDAIGLNTAQSNVTWTVNSSGISLDGRGYAGTGTTFAGANISGSMTNNSAGLNLSLSVAAPGAAAENNNINLLGANTAGNTTASGSTIGWSGQGVTLSGTNGSQVVISAPATSSISGTGQVSISVNGSTISIGVPNASTLSGYNPYSDLPMVAGQIGQGTLRFEPEIFPNFQCDRILLPMHNTNSSNSSGSHTLSFWVGIYTRNASSLSLYSSVSASTALTHSGTAGSYSLYSGIRHFTIGMTNTFTEGEYWIGFISRTTSGGTNGSYSNMLVSNVNSAFQGFFGSSNNTTMQFTLGQGFYTVTTSALPASVAFTQIRGSDSMALRAPIMLFASSTV